ncbi:MAG: 16S rRNA (guanine(966)-N(2))-methyltransferase RsmD [Acidobacteriota bacterium]|nr:MAG: 16S rRNA (guanine(966)-N(2))-methyltransferase RsmD [Acidobacteriota bacterium]
MRIVSGRFKGRVLAPVPRRGLRPTADPVREALFNILGPAVASRPFVDLCAGTGAVGLEALSRGACPVILVEHARAALRVIERNIRLLGIDTSEGELSVYAGPVEQWLARGAPRLVRGVPTTIFLDPPYGERRTGRWVAALAEPGLVGEGSLLVLEHRHREPPELAGVPPIWSRRYGDTVLTAVHLG